MSPLTRHYLKIFVLLCKKRSDELITIGIISVVLIGGALIGINCFDDLLKTDAHNASWWGKLIQAALGIVVLGGGMLVAAIIIGKTVETIREVCTSIKYDIREIDQKLTEEGEEMPGVMLNMEKQMFKDKFRSFGRWLRS